jgi:hypothetical protein
VITIFSGNFFVCFYFLFAKNFAEFFSNDHERFEGFFDSFGDALDEGVIGEDVFGLSNGASLEHLLPYLV